MSEHRIERVTDRERLWTPWRMRYIARNDAGKPKETGCVFCNALAGDDDTASLVLHRGDRAFVIVNLFPYNSGHIMIVPNEHIDDPAMLDGATSHEMADLMPLCVRALRRVFSCQGFNIGFNVGSAAGAGIAEHVHEHIVPRWVGDANFMPVLASTIAIPELIPASYAKIRAELAREIHGTTTATVLMLVDDDRAIVTRSGRPPTVTPDPDQPVWRAAIGPFRSWMDGIEVAGWGGPANTLEQRQQTALILRGSVARSRLPDGFEKVRLDAPDLDADIRTVLDRAMTQLAPKIAPPDLH